MQAIAPRNLLRSHNLRHHLTSTLNRARNDTGRTAFCGPVVISAIVGWSVSKVEDAIREARPDGKDAEEIIEGTTTEEVTAALEIFGYAMEPVEDFWHLEKKQRPTVWTWLQRRRSPWRHYVLAIHKGKEGHWICIKGCKLCDTYTDGQWVFAAEGPHRGARIMEVYAVSKQVKPLAVASTLAAEHERRAAFIA